MNEKIVNLAGRIFGRLTVLDFARVNKHHQAEWRCQCECGEMTIANGNFLRRGLVRSCGCLRRERMTQHGQSHSLQYSIFHWARNRAKKAGLPFNLTLEDIVIPDYCPVLGIPLIPQKNRSGPNSPTLDRREPKLGYVRGNIRVISNRANMLKNNATLEELEKIVAYVRSATA